MGNTPKEQLEKMNNFHALLKELKALKLIQESGDWIEDLPEEIWRKHFRGNDEQIEDNYEVIADNIDVDEHRWYILSISVYKIYDLYLGVNHVSSTKSESSEIESFYHELEFFEMKEKTKITYEKI